MELEVLRLLKNHLFAVQLVDTVAIDAIGYHNTAALLEYHVILRSAFLSLLTRVFQELGSLEDWIRQGSRKPLSPDVIVDIAKQLAKVRVCLQPCSDCSVQNLYALHALRVYHCDLAARNILLRGKRDSPTVSISDFGLAKIVSSDERSFSKDIVALRRVLLQLMTGSVSIKEPLPDDMQQRAQRDHPEVYKFAAQLSESLDGSQLMKLL